MEIDIARALDVFWLLVLVVVIVASVWLTRPFRHGGTAFFWPWYDGRRDDRAQLTYIAEEELKRSAEERNERDLAP